MGYALPGTPLDINQKTRVIWQSLSLLILNVLTVQEHVTIPHMCNLLHNMSSVEISCTRVPLERRGFAH